MCCKDGDWSGIDRDVFRKTMSYKSLVYDSTSKCALSSMSWARSPVGTRVRVSVGFGDLLLLPRIPEWPPASASKVHARAVVINMRKKPRTKGAPGKNGRLESDVVNILKRNANTRGPTPDAIALAPYNAP